MSEGDEIEDFLLDSAGQGQVLGTEESFSLAPEKIWARLQQLLPKKEFWILKLVQAAVAWGANTVRFTVTDENFCAAFALPSPAPDPEEFWATDVLTGPFHHLRVAVATVTGEQDTETVSLDWQTAKDFVRFSWKGKEHQREELTGTEQTPGLRLTIVPVDGSWLGKIFRGDLFHEEWYALKDRLDWKALNIWVNEEPLASLEPNERFFRPVLAETYPDQGNVSCMAYRIHRSLVLPRYLDFMKSSKYKDRRGDYGSRLMPVTATTIHWVLDGIVIDQWRRDSLEAAVAADIYISAVGLELDLSGFAVSPSDEAERRVTETRAQQLSLLDHAKTDLSQKLEHAVHYEKVKKSVYGIDLLVGFCFPPYLLLGLVEVFRLPKTSKRLLEADRILCLEHIEKRSLDLTGEL